MTEKIHHYLQPQEQRQKSDKQHIRRGCDVCCQARWRNKFGGETNDHPLVEGEHATPTKTKFGGETNEHPFVKGGHATPSMVRDFGLLLSVYFRRRGMEMGLTLNDERHDVVMSNPKKTMVEFAEEDNQGYIPVLTPAFRL